MTEHEDALRRIGGWQLDKALEKFPALRADPPPPDDPIWDRYHGWLLMVRAVIDEALET